MNKLEEYRDKKSKEHGKFAMSDVFEDIPLTEYHKESSFEDGFNAAIALDLPVKFSEWKDKNWKKFDVKLEVLKKIHVFDRNVTTKELYQYWLENVFKINP